ncbi:unnamed protein product [Calypogeia fissa]
MGIFGNATSNSVWMKSSIRPTLTQVIGLLSVVAHSFIIWQGLIVATGTKSPIVVVLSASMEPAFKKGDVVFLHNSKRPIEVGEIVVYQLPGREIPIIHRVVSLHEKTDGGVELLTKGDHNNVNDLGIYGDSVPGLRWLEREQIIGRAVGLLPSVGWATLILQEYPIIKYTLFPALGVALLGLDYFD